MRTDPGIRRLSRATVAIGTTISLVAMIVAASTPSLADSSTPVSSQPSTYRTACTTTTVTTPSQSLTEPTRPSAQLSGALLEDLTLSAEEEGITLAQAIDRYAWQPSFATMIAEIRGAYPDQVAGVRVEADGNARAWIAFAGAAPTPAVDLIRTFPEPLAIREHCGYTEVALKGRLEEIHYTVWDRQDLVAEVSSGYDTATGVITVFVEPREPGDSASRSRLQHQLIADLPPGPSNMPVDLRVLNNLSSSEDTVYGGRPLRPECTSGFNVVGAVTRGIATAGHCKNDLTYFGRSLRFINQHEGRFGDVQWHTRDGENHPNEFYNGSGLRPVNQTVAAQEGFRVCLYGKVSGNHCDDVYQLNHCNGGHCALVAMQNREAAGGDSGGPWYFGFSAYGIHQGFKWHFGSRDLYTPVVLLPDALGARVATS